MSVWCLQPEKQKVIHKCVWPSFSRSTHQGQVTDFGFSEILDLANVRIDTKIKSVACIQSVGDKIGHTWPWVPRSTVKVTYIFFIIFDIRDLENVRIDTKINFVSCLQPEIRKVMQKGAWAWFSRSYNKFFHYHCWIPWPWKTYPWEIFSKNWWYPPHFGRPKVYIYLGHLRVNVLFLSYIVQIKVANITFRVLKIELGMQCHS